MHHLSIWTEDQQRARSFAIVQDIEQPVRTYLDVARPLDELSVSEATTSIEWIRDFAERWLQAWNSHEVDRVLALMTEDVEYRDDAWHKTMRGHADVREFIERSSLPAGTLRVCGVDHTMIDPEALGALQQAVRAFVPSPVPPATA